jgi:hypothetical protein
LAHEAARFSTSVIFQRRSYNGSHSNRPLASPAFGGCSFLRDSRAEHHSAVQRSPRSHSSASLRSRSAVALSSWARASLRYRIARALLISNPTQQREDSTTGKKFGSEQRWRARAGRPDFVFRSRPHSGSPPTKPSPAASVDSAKGHLAKRQTGGALLRRRMRLGPPSASAWKVNQPQTKTMG